MSDSLELLWLGHAGILVRSAGTLVAVDPFLTGTFWWNGARETYQGGAPFAGPAGVERFVEQYAARLSAVLVTHAHGDHCDLPLLARLLAANPDIEILAPYPVVDWLRASSVFDPVLTRFFTPVAWDGAYEVAGDSGCLEVGVLPNPGIPREPTPYRVGYFVGPPGAPGVVHPGDAHEVGPWDAYQARARDLVLWPPKKRAAIVEYFVAGGALARVWWIHWEPFTPGNFTCDVPRADIEAPLPPGGYASLFPSFPATWQALTGQDE